MLLADEPTGNLDRNSGQEVVNDPRGACTSTGLTLIVVTHDPEIGERAHAPAAHAGRGASWRRTGAGHEARTTILRFASGSLRGYPRARC